MRWLACLGLASAVIACAGRREAPRSEAASTEEPAAEPSVTSASAEETSATANTNGGAPGAAPAAPHVMTLDERLAEAGDGDVAALRELLRSESGAPVPPARSDPADEDGVRRLPERAELLDAIHALLPTAHACSTEEVGAVTLEVVLAGSTGRVLRTRAARSELTPATVRCVRRAFAGLEVPAFSAETFTFHYPVHLGE